MARTGLYLSEVRKARDALIAQGRHPSVDAVRVALGNTGSKTTIHKYLKELDEEDGGAAGRKASIGEALQDLVERLAARLHEEADARVTAVEAARLAQERSTAAQLEAVHGELATARAQIGQLAAAAESERDRHARTSANLQAEAIARRLAEQQVADLKERLFENDEHLRSLEEKHTHARDALEHYRQSVKEQRDQDQRRHEQQVQQLQAEIRQLRQDLVVKHDEVTRLNQEGAKLVAELSHLKQALYEQQSAGRGQAKRIEQLQALEAQFAGQAAQLQAATERLAGADKRIAELTGQVRDGELALSAAQATLAAQQGIAAELRSFLSDTSRSGEPGGAATPAQGQRGD
jgi:chromosome segregation ATPase